MVLPFDTQTPCGAQGPTGPVKVSIAERLTGRGQGGIKGGLVQLETLPGQTHNEGFQAGEQSPRNPKGDSC